MKGKAEPDQDFYLPSDIYLASHSAGPVTRMGQDHFANQCLAPWEHQGHKAWDHWLPLIDSFCEALAHLIGGNPEEFCPQPNCSAALTQYLTSLPAPRKDRNIILMHATAFPSMGFVGKALKTRGYELRLIPKEHPPHALETWENAISSRIACALITHVHSNSGYLSPVKEIAAMCTKEGCHVVVDIAQSVGIIPMRISDWGVDMVFGSCLKWLCGGPGAGFMWVNPQHLSSLEPDNIGWFSHQNPFEFDIHHFQYASSAKRFWGGTPSIIPYSFALGGIETLANFGIKNIRQHNLKLMQLIKPDLNLSTQGGTLCLPISQSTAHQLSSAGCQFDQRGPIARLSFHIFNTETDAITVRKCLEA